MVLPLLLVVVSLPFYVLAIWMAGWFIIAIHHDFSALRWPRTAGKIEETWVVSNRTANGLPGWHWKVRYSYTVPDAFPVVDFYDEDSDDPEEWDPTEVRPASREVEGVESSRFRYRTRRGAERVTSRFRVGDTVQVAFDPSEPRYLSTLRPGLRADAIYPAALAVIFAAAAGALTYLAVVTIHA